MADFATSSLAQLGARLNKPLESIKKAHALSAEMKALLRKSLLPANVFSGGNGSDRAFVVFGSLARNEFSETQNSDIDWTLLVDGLAYVQDLDSIHSLASLVKSLDNKNPNPAGAFGALAFSHELIHQIGGEDDSNSNTTRRLLLLLESEALFGEEVRSRVIRSILHRYIYEDQSFVEGKHNDHVHRFLLNDVTRFWRTMAVDFQAKKRERNNVGFALRNIKLRFSRKLLFLSGLLSCFSFKLLSNPELDECWKHDTIDLRALKLTAHLEDAVSLSPLELIAQVLFKYPELDSQSAALLSAYDMFLGTLANSEKRERLNSLNPEEMAEDITYQDIRQVSRDFQSAIEKIFLCSSCPISELVVKYKVF